ncbi:MBL fold metallo-hydrolase [Halovivax sp.]|uniref:MBL fold metallo-hydrolase n=1 Tax=Halovivax sp. TaxID=1935978 RepID=UPI0025C05A99|nr:MBL fold metallo-hydrolase [Halovivax sp.]
MNAITLGNHEFEGKNNTYLLESNGTVALIDTGIPRPSIRDELADGLAARNRSFADVDLVVLTHFHIDHAGLAGEVAEAAGGAPVLIHEDDEPMVRHDEDALDAYDDLQERRFEEWGMPADKRTELREFLEDAPDIDAPDEIEPIADGDEIEIGDVSLDVVHSPGHTAGLCSFEFERDGAREAFVGDVILPVYTPNVGGADLRLDGALGHYLETLERIADRDYDRVWPGHRDVIDDPTGRAETIREHHHERTERVVNVLREAAPATAWEVSDALFGSLENIHILHGPGEAFAHLDHLADHDVVERTDEGYRLVDDAPDIDRIVGASSR